MLDLLWPSSAVPFTLFFLMSVSLSVSCVSYFQTLHRLKIVFLLMLKYSSRFATYAAATEKLTLDGIQISQILTFALQHSLPLTEIILSSLWKEKINS